MTAKDFWRKFQALFKNDIEALTVARENWENPTDFTNKFVKVFLPRIMKEKDTTEIKLEYYRVDIVAYNNERKKEAEEAAKDLGLTYKEFKPYLWDLEIALEHENDREEWLDELVKLSYINCPLRIVISYALEENKEKCLSLAATVLQKIVRSNTPVGQEFMLILGKSDIPHDQVNEKTYEAYIYKDGEFCPMAV